MVDMNKKTIISATVLPLAIILGSSLSAHAAILPVSANTTSTITVNTTSKNPSVVPTVTTSGTATVGMAPTTANGQITSTQVGSDADLNAYTSAALASDVAANAGASTTDDAEIKTVSYQDNGVTVNFTQPAKFLGFFPTSIDAQVVVKADGSTTVSYPWYGFLVRKHAAAMNSIFQTQVTEATDTGSTDMGTNASATLAPQAKATILDAIRQAIHGLRSKTAVSASASANAQ
jgi:hypothetical protein